MNWKLILALIFTAPLVALMGGVGILAWQVGETWSEAVTASLVTGLVTVCGGGMVLAALLLTLIIGIPYSVRLLGDLGTARRAWDVEPGPRVLPGPRGWSEERPPMIEAKPEGGSWQTGQAPYDLWDDDAAPDRVRGEW